MKIVDEGGAPITVDQFRRRANVDEGDPEDLAALIAAAVATVETAAGRMIGQRTVEFVTPGGGWRRWWFPLAPVVEIVKVEIEDAAGDLTPLPPEAWRLARAYDEPQLVIRQADVPAGALQVTAKVGLDGKGKALPLTQAASLLAKEWFDAGIVISDLNVPAMTMGAMRLIRQNRYRRPMEVGHDPA